jgi:hypothetical protein
MRLAAIPLALILAVALSAASEPRARAAPTSMVMSRSGGVPTLGSSKFYAPNSKGFGSVRPTEIFNGGDPSGLVTKIHWSTWGGTQAEGHGLNAIFAPKGGYYGQLVRIDLLARDRGKCPGSSRPVYRQLLVREPSRPGGPDGKWFLWSGAHDLCASGP